jgi:hypothetical protein
MSNNKHASLLQVARNVYGIGSDAALTISMIKGNLFSLFFFLLYQIVAFLRSFVICRAGAMSFVQ